MTGFEDANRDRHGCSQAVDAIKRLLNTGPAAEDVSAITSTTAASLSPAWKRVMNQLPFSRQTKRTPLFGLGCLAGVAGLNRVGDYLKGHPKEAAILVSVELCSLTLQKRDLSIANIIASGLFGDGCAAVLMVGDEHPLAQTARLRWQSPRSAFFPDTERVMGDVDTGFKVIQHPMFLILAWL